MVMKTSDNRIKLLAAFLLFSSGALFAQVQYGWRGPERSGIYNESGLLKSWPATGPVLLWETTVAGSGYSSVTVTPEDIYLTGKKGDQDVLTALTQDGKKKWEIPYGKAPDSGYPESRCTPTYSNGKIFVVSGMGDMVCVGKDGKKIWSVNYFKKYGARVPMFGISESPLVVGNLVIGTPGGTKTSMVAFNINNGIVAWEAPNIYDETNYVNPLMIENNGMKIIVTITARHIIAVNSANGKLLWKFDYEAANADPNGDRAHINTPVYRDGYFCAAQGYGQVAVKFKLNPDNAVPTVVWKNTDLTPLMGGMVLLGNYIFSSTHDTDSKGRWICVDWTTGKTLWITDWNNKGPIISADGLIYIMEEKNGNIGLVNPSSDKLDVISSFRVTKGTGPYWTHPVIDKGRLFVRHGDYLGVYSLK
jgi:outer membrane protein assembly factor BamB